jgi:hypothetical protein
MDIKLDLDYNRPDNQEHHPLDEYVFHARVNHIQPRLFRNKRGQEKPGRKFGATVLSFYCGGRVMTAVSRLNPSDPSFSRRAGIISAMVNFVEDAYPAAEKDQVVCVKADRVINDEFNGFEFTFVTARQAHEDGYLYEEHWWLKHKQCPSHALNDSREARIQKEIENGAELRERRLRAREEAQHEATV